MVFWFSHSCSDKQMAWSSGMLQCAEARHGVRGVDVAQRPVLIALRAKGGANTSTRKPRVLNLKGLLRGCGKLTPHAAVKQEHQLAMDLLVSTQ